MLASGCFATCDDDVVDDMLSMMLLMTTALSISGKWHIGVIFKHKCSPRPNESIPWNCNINRDHNGVLKYIFHNAMPWCRTRCIRVVCIRTSLSPARMRTLRAAAAAAMLGQILQITCTYMLVVLRFAAAATHGLPLKGTQANTHTMALHVCTGARIQSHNTYSHTFSIYSSIEM